jgi:hypothetical protein
LPHLVFQKKPLIPKVSYYSKILFFQIAILSRVKNCNYILARSSVRYLYLITIFIFIILPKTSHTQKSSKQQQQQQLNACSSDAFQSFAEASTFKMCIVKKTSPFVITWCAELASHVRFGASSVPFCFMVMRSPKDNAIP